MFVKERMNKNVVYVKENLTLAKTLVTMKESKHRRLPVVNAENKPIGIIDQRSIEAVGSAGFMFSSTKLADIMDTSFYKINESTLIEDCALVMKENKTAFLPVVDGNDNLSGVITSYDVLKGLMRLMDIRGEGCRMVVKSTDVAGLAGLVARSGSIKNIIVDGENTIIKFDSANGDEIKERVNAQYDVVYFKEL